MTTKKLFRTKDSEWTTHIGDLIKANEGERLEMLCFTFDPTTNKICRKCLEVKLYDEFYKYKDKYISPCKKCQKISSAKRWKSKRKGSGFERLPHETQEEILRRLADGENACKIARVTGISYQNLRLWIIKGQIPKTI